MQNDISPFLKSLLCITVCVTMPELEDFRLWIWIKCSIFEEMLVSTFAPDKSTDESVLSMYLKRVGITPLIQRSGLDRKDMKYYRHILTSDGYAYRRGHWTETALLKVHTDIAEELLMKDQWLHHYDWFICSLWCNRCSDTNEAFIIFIWHQGKYLKLGKVVPQKSLCLSDWDQYFSVSQAPVL